MEIRFDHEAFDLGYSCTVHYKELVTTRPPRYVGDEEPPDMYAVISEPSIRDYNNYCHCCRFLRNTLFCASEREQDRIISLYL